MRASARLRAFGAVVGSLLVVGTACASRSEIACSCVHGDPILIHAPAGSIRAIHLSGPACASAATPSVSTACPEETGTVFAPSASDCERASVAPNAAGECDVAIERSDGSVVTRRYTLQAYSGCCGDGFSVVAGGDNAFIDLIPSGDAGSDG